MEPIIEKLNINFIIEIGSDYGVNTKNILEYCLKENKKMVAIDPNPKFDLDEFNEIYGDKFKLYQDLSLLILPSLKDYDCVLVDGDHNWYTVYNELKIIENSADKEFPLVFLHDIYWPYGRRDLYYDPETIPDKYLNPYKKEAIDINTDTLANNGLNGHLNNALNSNTKHNGVLTAIEDFMEGSDFDLNFIKINAFHGLGILYEKNSKLKKIIESVIAEGNLLELVEKNYLTKIINLQNDVKSLRGIKSSLEKVNEDNVLEIGRKDDEIRELIGVKESLEKVNEDNVLEIGRKDDEIKSLFEDNKHLKEINSNHEMMLNTKNKKISALEKENNSLHNINLNNIKKITENDVELAKLNEENEILKDNLSEFANEKINLKIQKDQIDKIEKEKEFLEQINNENTEIILKKNQNIVKLEKTLEKQINDNESMQNEIISLKINIESLLEKIDKKERKIKDLNSLSSNLSDEIKLKENKLAKLFNQIDHLELINENKNNIINSLKDNDKSIELESLREDYDSLLDRNSQLSKTKMEQFENIKSLRYDKKSLINEVNSFENKINQLNNTIKDLQKINENKNNIINSLKDNDKSIELESLREDYDSLLDRNSQLSKTKNEQVKVINSLRDENQNLIAEGNKKNKQISSLKKNIEEKALTIDSLKDNDKSVEFQSLQRDYDILLNENSQLSENNNNQFELINSLKNEKKELISECDDKNRKIEELINFNGELELKEQKKSRDLVGVENENKNLEKNNISLLKINGEQKEKIRSLKKEKENLIKTVREYKNLVEEYENSSSWKVTKPLRDAKKLLK